MKASPHGSSLPRVRLEPTNFVLVRFAELNLDRVFSNLLPEKSAPVRFAEEKFVLLIVAPRKSAFVSVAPPKLVPVRFFPAKEKPMSLAFRRSVPVSVAPVNTTFVNELLAIATKY